MAQEAEARVLRGALAIKQTRECAVKSAKIVVNTAVEEITTVTNNAHGDSNDGVPSAVAVLAAAISQRRTNCDGEDDNEVESDEAEIISFIAGRGRR